MMGVDPAELPLDRFCNLVYFWMVENRDQDGRAEVDAMLAAVAPGQPVESGPWSAEAEMDAFAAAQRATSAV